MSPLEQWLLNHRPRLAHTAATSAAPYPMNTRTGKNVRFREPLTHAELWAALIADSDYLESFELRDIGGLWQP